MSFLIVALYEETNNTTDPYSGMQNGDAIIGKADTLKTAETEATKFAPKHYARGATDILIYDPVKSVRPAMEIKDVKS